MLEKLAKAPQSLIFLGEEKEEMYLSARELASKWLSTSVEELAFHPDFLDIAPEDGSIVSEKAVLISDAAKRKAMCEKAVCIVQDAELMTKELQNKLLKSLEDGAKNLAVIFITSKELLDTIASRCMTVRFKKIPVAQMAVLPEFKSVPVVLASDGSAEAYRRIEEDNEFSVYLEGFFKSLCAIKERSQLKNIFSLAHALKEKDPEYLPDKLSEWQMRSFLNLLKHIYWNAMLKTMGLEIPSHIRLGNLSGVYRNDEVSKIYEEVERAIEKNRKKGQFTKHDFFLLLMYMVPAGKEDAA